MVRPFDKLMVLSEVEAQAHHKWEGIKGRVNLTISSPAILFTLTQALSRQGRGNNSSLPCPP